MSAGYPYRGRKRAPITTIVNFRCSEQLAAQLDAACAQVERSRAYVVRELLREALTRRGIVAPPTAPDARQTELDFAAREV